MVRSSLFMAVPLWMTFGQAVALTEPETCYVLDAFLFLYGIILTVLYCRLKIRKESVQKIEKGKQCTEERVYTGLAPHDQDTYAIMYTKK
ncbi:high affinity immunoglobulin epsilon receptor subunit gamma [Stigmatopora argus]